MRIILTF